MHSTPYITGRGFKLKEKEQQPGFLGRGPAPHLLAVTWLNAQGGKILGKLSLSVERDRKTRHKVNGIPIL